MRIKKDKDLVTSDFYYDLFEGGYIDPEDYLYSEEDLDKVIYAIGIINQFRYSLEEAYPEMYS